MNNVDVSQTRINKLAKYLVSIIKDIIRKNVEINANMLSKNINNYSLDKIPTESTVEKWIIGKSIFRDVYSFRSRAEYSTDAINNLKNIGFFEEFERVINSNNKKGVLPDIEGIESIECLNPGSMVSTSTNTAEFDIQIQITYRSLEV